MSNQNQKENEDNEWLEDNLLAKQMKNIIEKFEALYPDFDTTEIKNNASKGLIPNPFKLEKSDKIEERVLAGLIHREYALLLLIGILGVEVGDDGRAYTTENGRRVDITDTVLEMIPHISSACSFAILGMANNDNLAKEINELINVVTLLIYYSIVLKSPETLEKILAVLVYALSRINENYRTQLASKLKSEMERLGLSEIGNIFDDFIAEKS